MQIITRAEAKAQGLKRYFTGKPCKHGHISHKQTSNGECLECAGLRPKAPVDPERKKENDRRYYQRHKEKLDKTNRAYYEKNKDRLKEVGKLWVERNKEQVKAYKKQWMQENYPRLLEKFRQQRKEKPWIHRAMTAKRRAAKRRAIPKWVDKQKIKEIYANTPEGCAVDHIVPLISDFVCGLHVHDNLQYLTVMENACKSNKWWPDMW